MQKALHSSQDQAPFTRLKQEAIDEVQAVQGINRQEIHDKVLKEIQERHFKNLVVKRLLILEVFLISF